jgi:hypothetical protein
MSTAPSIDEVKTMCSDISNHAYHYGVVAFISVEHLLHVATWIHIL